MASPAAIVLAEALRWHGRGDEAEAVLADVDPDGADEWLIVRWGCLRAANLFFNCGQAEHARLVLANMSDRVEAIATHAHGLADHNGGLLDGAAGRFSDLGALALAADALAQAAGEPRRWT